MPRVDGGAESVGLRAIRGVPDNVVEFAVAGGRPDVQLFDGITQTVSSVLRTVRVAGFRRPGHPDSHPPNRHGAANQLQRYFSSLAVRNRPAGKRYPRPRGGLANRIYAGPILDEIVLAVGISPINLYGVDVLQAREVHNYPLGVQGVVFTRVGFRQIGIALPVCVGVPVGQPRIAAPIRLRKSRMWQGVSKRVADEFSRRSIANEIAFLAGFAPGAFGIPVPGFHVEFRILPIGYGLPAGRKDLLKHRL